MPITQQFRLSKPDSDVTIEEGLTVQRRQCGDAAMRRVEEERTRGKKKDTVVEQDSVHSVRCKLFFKKEKEFKEKGLGMLHLKPVSGDDGKTQMVVRAETNLGSILLSIILSDKMQFAQRGNNVQVSVDRPVLIIDIK